MRINSKKYIRNIFSSLVCFSLMTSSAAGFDYKVEYAGGDTDFKLSGKTYEGIGGQIVTLKVEKGGNVEYTRQTETNRLGEYSFDFNILQGASGDINIVINDGTGAESKTFYKSTSGEVDRALTAVNSAVGSAGIIAAVSANDSETSTAVHKILQLDAADFGNGALIPEYFSGKTFDTLDVLLKEYEKGKFLQAVKNSTDGAVLCAMMNECKMAETLSGNTADVFNAYTTNEKAQLLNNIKGNPFTSDDAFKNALYDAVIINELSKVSTDTEKWAVLSQNNDYLLLSLSTYENSTVFASLKAQLFANAITSIDTMKSNIAVIYSTLTAPPPGGDDGGGGGNGGGGGKREYPSASGDLVTSLTDSPKFGFNDLSGYEWAEDAILSLAADGIINGKGNSAFAPADNVTRAEFAKIIIGAFDLVTDNASASFTDVAASHWGYRYIASAASKGIVNGVSAQMFNPDGKITRQDMATICYRVLESKGIAADSANAKEFMDAGEISDYAKTAVDVLSSLGIINGKGDGIFAPDDFATRAEAAKIIHSLRSLK